ncbi:MAG: CoA transferase [Chloroflexi bacterium]|nr:CoA transferase [Chloroflexota bacterium]MYD48456.1 CoA transferase [Chloroflexota bacterium]
MAGPLQGIRIIEMGQLIAIPSAMKWLADMGAQVIRLESVQRLESYRTDSLYHNEVEGEFWNRGANFYEQNRNKLGLTLDLSRDEGRAVLRDLIAVADVFAENFTPRVIKNFGLEYAELRKMRPDIIMVSSTGYGFEGPWSNFGATGPATEGAAGLAYMTGYRDGGPMMSEIPYTDYTAGEHTVAAVMLALMHRLNTGQGQFIDVSQTQTCSATIPEALLDWTVNGRVSERIGNEDPAMAPHGCYPCAGDDRWIAIAIDSDEAWLALCRVMARPDWAADARYGDVLSRIRRRAELDMMLAFETRGHDNHELMARLQAEGVAAGAVVDSENLLFNEHLKARGFYEVVAHHPATGMPPLPYASRPWKLSETPAVPPRPAPIMGQHNWELLAGLLGRTDGEIAALEESNVIGYAPLTPRGVRRPSLDEQVRQGRMQKYDTDYAERVRRWFGVGDEQSRGE